MVEILLGLTGQLPGPLRLAVAEHAEAVLLCHHLRQTATGRAAVELEGVLPLRKAAREEFFGRWDLPEHSLFISAGAKIAEFAAMRGLLPERSTVLIVGPAWPSYEDIVRMAGHTPAMLHLDAAENFRISANAVAQAMEESGAAAIILSNPCNPTGRVHDGDELAILLSVAERHDAYLMVDESFSNVMFDASAWQDARTRPSPRLLLFNSFSKNYHLQGLRVGVCMAHASIYRQAVAAHQTLMSSAPSLSQAAALEKGLARLNSANLQLLTETLLMDWPRISS